MTIRSDEITSIIRSEISELRLQSATPIGFARWSWTRTAPALDALAGGRLMSLR